MKSINIVECKNEKDLKEVAILAEKIWHEFFPGIISEAQIDYMGWNYYFARHGVHLLYQ